MRGTIGWIAAFAVAVVGLALLAVVAAPAVAGPAPTGDPGSPSLCGPLGIGWTCECNTTPGPSNVICLRPDGGSGHIVVTTCKSCPPPCREFPCYLQLCRTRTTYACV